MQLHRTILWPSVTNHWNWMRSFPILLFLTEKDASYRLLLEQYLAAMGKHLDPYLEIGNTDFILQFLRQNTGVTFLPHLQ